MVGASGLAGLAGAAEEAFGPGAEAGDADGLLAAHAQPVFAAGDAAERGADLGGFLLEPGAAGPGELLVLHGVHAAEPPDGAVRLDGPGLGARRLQGLDELALAVGERLLQFCDFGFREGLSHGVAL